MLAVERLTVEYNDVVAVRDVSLKVASGQKVAIVGANGAGKSSILNAVAGLTEPASGEVELAGRSLAGVPPYKRSALGLSLVPEGRRLFGRMSVDDNLELGAVAKGGNSSAAERRKEVLELFPILATRGRQRVDTMSGGEQQMLAIARGLMSNPSVLMLDEPSLGVAPQVVARIFEVLETINERGTAVLLVEQNVAEALELADHAYVMTTGEIVASGPAEEVLRSDLVKEAYLGLGEPGAALDAETEDGSARS